MEGIVLTLLFFIGLLIAAPFIVYTFFVYPALIVWINSFYPMSPQVQSAMYWVILFVVWLLLSIVGILARSEKTLRIRRE